MHCSLIGRCLPFQGCCQGGCGLQSNILPLVKLTVTCWSKGESLRQELHPQDAGGL